MVRDFPTDVIVEVLYETGTKRPKTISRKSGICLRTVQRYVSKLKQGLPPSRNPYKKRKGKVTSAIRKRVFTLPWPAYSPDLSPIENIWARRDCQRSSLYNKIFKKIFKKTLEETNPWISWAVLCVDA